MKRACKPVRPPTGSRSPLATRCGKGSFLRGADGRGVCLLAACARTRSRYPLCVLALAGGYVALDSTPKAIAVLTRGLMDNPKDSFHSEFWRMSTELVGQRAKR